MSKKNTKIKAKYIAVPEEEPQSSESSDTDNGFQLELFCGLAGAPKKSAKKEKKKKKKKSEPVSLDRFQERLKILEEGHSRERERLQWLAHSSSSLFLNYAELEEEELENCCGRKKEKPCQPCEDRMRKLRFIQKDLDIIKDIVSRVI